MGGNTCPKCLSNNLVMYRTPPSSGTCWDCGYELVDDKINDLSDLVENDNE